MDNPSNTSPSYTLRATAGPPGASSSPSPDLVGRTGRIGSTLPTCDRRRNFSRNEDQKGLRGPL